jgi:hypothetical protein
MRAVWQRLHQVLDEIQAEKTAKAKADSGETE